MNQIDIIILLILAAVLAVALLSCISSRRRHGCSGSCSCCTKNCSCHRRKDTPDPEERIV